MANMLLKANKESYFTKAACHCGRRQCSDARADQRRVARRREAQALRRELSTHR